MKNMSVKFLSIVLVCLFTSQVKSMRMRRLLRPLSSLSAIVCTFKMQSPDGKTEVTLLGDFHNKSIYNPDNEKTTFVFAPPNICKTHFNNGLCFQTYTSKNENEAKAIKEAEIKLAQIQQQLLVLKAKKRTAI